MVLTMQKRMAMSILNCGQRKVKLDPKRINEITRIKTRAGIRRLIDEGLIVDARTGKPREKTKESYDKIYLKKKPQLAHIYNSHNNRNPIQLPNQIAKQQKQAEQTKAVKEAIKTSTVSHTLKNTTKLNSNAEKPQQQTATFSTSTKQKSLADLD